MVWLEVMTVTSQLFGMAGEFMTSPTARTPSPEQRLMLDGMTLGPQTLSDSPVCADQDFANVAIRCERKPNPLVQPNLARQYTHQQEERLRRGTETMMEWLKGNQFPEITNVNGGDKRSLQNSDCASELWVRDVHLSDREAHVVFPRVRGLQTIR